MTAVDGASEPADEFLWPKRPSMTSWILGRGAALTLRPVGALIPANAWSTHLLRSASELALPMLSLGAGARVRKIDASWQGHSILGEWVQAESTSRADSVILYLHGSAFVFCSPRTHRGMVARLSASAGMPAFVPRYRRAPEYPFPAAADDALAAYRWLLSTGYPAERIVVAGDSAGGYLAIGLCLTLRRFGLPLPAGLTLFSPLLDPSYDTAAERDKVRHDPFIHVRVAKRLLALYFGGVQPDDERRSLLRSDLAGLPPILLQAGGAESLSADAEAAAELINRCGGSCRLEIWPEQMHVFQMLHRLIPEARAALTRAGAFAGSVITPERTSAPRLTA